MPVTAVAAARYGGNGQPVPLCAVKDHGIALAYPLITQGEIAKLVGMMHVHPGLIEDEIGGVEPQRQIERLCQRGEVGIVLHAAWQGEIHVGGGLVAGKIVFPVQGEGDDVAPPPAQGGTAIPLMDIEIDDQYLFAAPFVQTGLGGDHQIVEQAKAATKVPVGVVIATGDLQAAALREGVSAGGKGGPHRAQGAFNQHGGPGKPQLANGARIQGAGEGRFHIGRIVHSLYLGATGGRGLCQRITQVSQLFKQRLVFGQRKAMARWQGQGGVEGVMEDAQ